MKTEWKDVKGLEGYVQISNDGRFKKLARIHKYIDGQKRSITKESIHPAYTSNKHKKKLSFRLRIEKKFYCLNYDKIVGDYFGNYEKENIIKKEKEKENIIKKQKQIELKKILNKMKVKFKITNKEVENIDTGEAKIYAKIMNVDFETLCDAICTVGGE